MMIYSYDTCVFSGFKDTKKNDSARHIIIKGDDLVQKSRLYIPQSKQNQILISYEQNLLISFWKKTELVC